MCCILTSQTQCSRDIPWFASCSRLLPRTSMTATLSTITVVILVTNFLTLALTANSIKRSKRKKESTIFEYFSLSVNFSDVLCGTYLLQLLCFHGHYKDNFFIKEQSWQQSRSCLIVLLISFLFSISSPNYLMWLSMSRLMVILYPFDSKFKKSSFVKKSTDSQLSHLSCCDCNCWCHLQDSVFKDSNKSMFAIGRPYQCEYHDQDIDDTHYFEPNHSNCHYFNCLYFCNLEKATRQTEDNPDKK